jgi:hypothetical protein
MIPRFILLTALSCLCFLELRAADSPADTFTDPEKAGPDYAVQGEYVGDRAGAQVVALGNGKFRVTGWANGLPGAVDDAEKKDSVDAQRVGEKVVFQGNGFIGSIEGDTITARDDEGKTYTLKKTVRHSSTEGAKPPEGATVLFDGSAADAFEGGKVDPQGLLTGGTKTKKAFGSFTLHAEFRTPFMPLARGQGRGNSGVYLQNRYECQVLDSFGLVGEDNECGGIYHLLKPRLNMCYPPLTWQTYDIDFQAAQFDPAGAKTKNAVVTVKHNGVLIHDHREIKETTGGAGLKETPEPGPIALQNHGNPVFYRNIWILEKK